MAYKGSSAKSSAPAYTGSSPKTNYPAMPSSSMRDSFQSPGGLEQMTGNTPIYSMGAPSMGSYIGAPSGNLVADYINLLKKVKEYEFMMEAMKVMGAYGAGMGQSVGTYGQDVTSFAGYGKQESKPTKETVQKSESNLKIFDPTSFISSKTKMVSNADDVMNYVKDAFKETAGYDMPDNISINLCSESELKRAHNIFNGEWSDGIQGFCVNRLHGNSQVFVKKDELAKTMLTIGHELGHLQTSSLNPIEEEAKAYAFSIEWMNKIKQNNIAGLGNVILTDNPAENGLHNVAFDFVANLMKQGKSALEVFNGLIDNSLSAC